MLNEHKLSITLHQQVGAPYCGDVYRLSGGGSELALGFKMKNEVPSEDEERVTWLKD